MHICLFLSKGKLYLFPRALALHPIVPAFTGFTHTSDGVIHIEAPHKRAFTLGNLLDIWENQFGQLGYPTQLSATEGWVIFVNGKPLAGDAHSLPLEAHLLITLAYQSPSVQPDTTFNWNGL